MLDKEDEDIEEKPSEAWLFPNPFDESCGHDSFKASCGAVLDGNLTDQHWNCDFLQFAEDFLLLYRTKNKVGGARHADKYQSWVDMGRVHSPELFE